MKLFIILVMMILSYSSINAQEADQPLIILWAGDFYTVDASGTATPITANRLVAGEAMPSSQRDLAISPDGRFLAYLRTPDFFAQALANNLTGNLGTTPADVILLDTASGEQTVLAHHAEGTSWQDAERLWYRSELTWSPDGTQLAYAELHRINVSYYETRIRVYNMQTGSTRTISGTPENFWPMTWFPEGIAAHTTLFAPDGTVLAHNFLTEGSIVRGHMSYQGRPYAIISSTDVVPYEDLNGGQVYVMDMLTGEFGVIQGLISSVSATTSDQSAIFLRDDNDTRPAEVFDPITGANFIPPRQPPFAVDFTLSPDGRRFAYVLIGTNINIYNFDDGSTQTIDMNATALVWGGKQYTVVLADGQRMPVQPTTDFENSKRCGTLPALPLELGGVGRVIEGGGSNRIRSAPSVEAEQIGEIPAGSTFEVVDGQQGICAGGIRWAQVRYDGITGWTAQGADDSLFLEAAA